MKHTMMVLLVAVTLLTATGIATLAAYGTNGGDDERPAGVHVTPTEIIPSAEVDGRRSASDEGGIAGRKPGVVSGSTARSDAGPTVDISGPGSDDETIASSKPGVGVGSDWPKPIPKPAVNSDPGTGELIASSKPGLGVGTGGSSKPIPKPSGAVLAGGKGGIGGDCNWGRVA